jgi:hypothetical protein
MTSRFARSIAAIEAEGQVAIAVNVASLRDDLTRTGIAPEAIDKRVQQRQDELEAALRDMINTLRLRPDDDDADRQ